MSDLISGLVLRSKTAVDRQRALQKDVLKELSFKTLSARYGYMTEPETAA